MENMRKVNAYDAAAVAVVVAAAELVVAAMASKTAPSELVI